MCYYFYMNKDKRFILINVLDILTFVLMVLGITFSIVDVRFMGDYPRLSYLPIYATFTGLSNIFLGFVCLGCALYRLIKKEKQLPKVLFILKIIALAEITITFITTAFILAPNLGESWWRLYINNNLFNHLLTPLLSIVTFIILEEKVELNYRYCFLAIVPVLAYGFFYVPNVYTHLTSDGSVDLAYDIYGFGRFGPFVFFLFSLLFISFSIGFAFLYRLLNQIKRSY